MYVCPMNNIFSHTIGTMDVDSVKKRWKYLKDCYMKDRKKTNEYVASGSASTSKRKSTFRFNSAMSFLSDCIEPRPYHKKNAYYTILLL